MDSVESATREQLNIIEKRLDSIIKAPFREALMYLREGNRERGKEKLIEAISLNELDLPAAALYCSLILPTNRRLALEYYEDIARRFGPHRNIVPEVLLAWLEDFLTEGGLSTGTTGFEVHLDDHEVDYYPTAVFCSAWDIVVKWEYKNPRSGLDRFMGICKPRLNAYNWRGTKLLDVQSNNLSIVSITGNYVVVDTGKEGICIWDSLTQDFDGLSSESIAWVASSFGSRSVSMSSRS